jgi:uncharacterized Fe-S center protein
MFSCRDATQMITDEREGALVGWRGVRYRIHMTICVHCRRCKRQLEEAVHLSTDIAAEEVSKEIEEKALAAFRSRGKPSPG